MSGLGLAQPIITLSEAQAFVRVETGEEEAMLAGLVRSASALCEAFLNQVVIARDFSEELTATASWQRLRLSPMQAITSVEAIEAGVATSLPMTSYASDIDTSGDGWVRVADPGAIGRVRVNGTAGMASQEHDVPEPIRHGVLRLVAHLYASRDGPAGDPPTAVTALWRPYRRTRLE
jgi:uncharacterized phiE125 gp8 family phage protein